MTTPSVASQRLQDRDPGVGGLSGSLHAQHFAERKVYSLSRFMAVGEPFLER